MKLCTLKFLVWYLAQRVHEAKEKQKDRRKTQRCLNGMSWNSSYSVGWTDAIGWTDCIGSGSSDALGFGNSKGQGSASSALDDQTPWTAVYPTLAFKSYSNAPRFLFQHRINRHLMINPSVHLTPIFKLHSTAHIGCSSAPDGPTGRRCIAYVHWLGHVVQQLHWILWVTGWSTPAQGEPSVNPVVLLFQETFSNS
jgi:hypothetical protein